jgi:hypothetical protein
VSNILKAALCVFLFFTYGNAYAQDSQSDREKAVERYFKAMPFDTMIEEASVEMAKRLPEEQRADFVSFMTTEVRFDVILTAAKASLANRLTTDEINAFASFMESPLGKSSMAKMKFYMADVMPVVQAEVARAIEARKLPHTRG